MARKSEAGQGDVIASYLVRVTLRQSTSWSANVPSNEAVASQVEKALRKEGLAVTAKSERTDV